MSASLSISSDPQYLFTVPFNVNRLHGVGCGTTGTMLRAEDLMFIYEAIEEFLSYTDYIGRNEHTSERIPYDSGTALTKYENGILNHPKNIVRTSRVYYVNGTDDTPYWFDSKATLEAPITEYSSLPPLYQIFGLTESDCYHYSDIYYNKIQSIMSSSRNLNSEIIHGFYSGISTLHGMWFRCDVHGYSGKQILEETKHKGGNGVGLSPNQDSYVYPVIEDYPEGEQHSESDEDVAVPSFSNDHHLYSFSASAIKKLANYYLRHWNSQGGYWEYDDHPTLSETKSSYDYSLSARKTKSGYPVRFWLWQANAGMFNSPLSFKVFAKMSHKIDNDTYYRIVDLSEKFSLSQDGGMFVLEGSIDGNDATEYFTNVFSPNNIRYPDDPPTPSPGNDSTSTAHSESTIDLYGLFAVVKPDFNATFTE
jgi:hypothetical protein